MPRDLPDVWRDEDGPSEADIDRWASGEIASFTVDRDRRRVLRIALKSLWSASSPSDQRVIDDLLDELKAA